MSREVLCGSCVAAQRACAWRLGQGCRRSSPIGGRPLNIRDNNSTAVLLLPGCVAVHQCMLAPPPPPFSLPFFRVYVCARAARPSPFPLVLLQPHIWLFVCATLDLVFECAVSCCAALCIMLSLRPAHAGLGSGQPPHDWPFVVMSAERGAGVFVSVVAAGVRMQSCHACAFGRDSGGVGGFRIRVLCHARVHRMPHAAFGRRVQRWPVWVTRACVALRSGETSWAHPPTSVAGQGCASVSRTRARRPANTHHPRRCRLRCAARCPSTAGAAQAAAPPLD
jgi:hypothetical protein